MENSTNTVYLVTCGAHDEDGVCNIAIEKIDDYFANAAEASYQLCNFLSQTDPSYLGEKDFIYETYDGVNQLFGKYLDDINEDTIQTLYADLKELGRQDVIDALEPEIATLREQEAC